MKPWHTVHELKSALHGECTQCSRGADAGYRGGSIHQTIVKSVISSRQSRSIRHHPLVHSSLGFPPRWPSRLLVHTGRELPLQQASVGQHIAWLASKTPRSGFLHVVSTVKLLRRTSVHVCLPTCGHHLQYTLPRLLTSYTCRADIGSDLPRSVALFLVDTERQEVVVPLHRAQQDSAPD